jgi:hypothetical protein
VPSENPAAKVRVLWGPKWLAGGAGMAWGPGTLLILPIGSKHCPDLTFWIKGRELLLRSDRTCFPGSELISVAGKGPNATPPHEAERSLTIDQRQSTVPQQRLWENGRRLCFARYKWSQGRPTSMKPGRMALLASVGCARTASLSYLRHCREHQISHSAALATRTQQFLARLTLAQNPKMDLTSGGLSSAASPGFREASSGRSWPLSTVGNHCRGTDASLPFSVLAGDAVYPRLVGPKTQVSSPHRTRERRRAAAVQQARDKHKACLRKLKKKYLHAFHPLPRCCRRSHPLRCTVSLRVDSDTHDYTVLYVELSIAQFMKLHLLASPTLPLHHPPRPSRAAANICRVLALLVGPRPRTDCDVAQSISISPTLSWRWLRRVGDNLQHDGISG